MTIGRRTISARVDDDLFQWFDEHFPAHGMKQWFLANCLKKLKQLHDEGKYESPVDILEITVKEVVS